MGKDATVVLFAFISFLALREFITLTPTKRGDHVPLFLSFFVLIPVQYFLIAYGWYGLFAIFIPVYAFLLLPAFAALAEDTDHFLERTAKIQWAVMVTVFCVSHAPALLLLDIPGYQGQDALLMLYLLLVAQLSDVLQYVSGKLFGRTKIAPNVSPSKTREGLIGGGLGAILVGGAMWWITPFSPPQAMGMSFIIVLMGFLGGLALSAVKRSLGAKDWGSMIEGHGGMLDRIDSISFAAPIFFHLTRYFFA
jgi:phosphatidate cytidylyltransferase